MVNESDGEEEEEKHEQEPPHTLSAAMVRLSRLIQHSEWEILGVLANIRASEVGARLARANLFTWRANNAGRAHGQAPEVQGRHIIEEQVLQNQVDMWDQVIADARMGY